MNKADFLKELSFYLHKMKDTEKNKFITYYDEIISDYIENGMSEEAAVSKIGVPEKIAEELLESHDSAGSNVLNTNRKVINLILLILGFPLWGSLLLAGILFLISIYIIFWCVPVTAGVSCIGFFAASIISIIGSPFILSESLPVGMVQLGAGVASVGMALLLGMATIYLSKKFINVTRNFNLKLAAIFKRKVVI